MFIKTRIIDGMNFSFTNEQEFEFIYNEVFRDNIYQFTTDTPTPFIVDCGAHIGVSVLYFKKLYPQARVIAFEPNPDTFSLLELNIKQNDVSGVEVINAALADNIKEIDFYICEETSSYLTWAWGFAGVKNAWYNPDMYSTIKVPAVKLSSYIHEPVDFLKLDIEGMEEIVLKEIENKLRLIRKMKMEFHGSIINKVNSLERILSLLEKNKFTLEMKQRGEIVAFEDIVRTDPFKVKMSIF